MYVFSTEGFDATEALIEFFMNERDAIAGGKAMKDVARANGTDVGFSKGVTQALFFQAVEQRIRKAQLLLGNDPEFLSQVAAPDPWEIEKWLGGHRHEYRKVFNESSHGVNTAERDKNRKIAQERQAAYFQKVMDEWITHIVWPEDVAEQYEARRRGLIRSGKRQPSQADAEWLAEELQSMAALADPLRELVTKAKNADA